MINIGLAEANKRMLDKMSDEEYQEFLREHPEYVQYIKDMDYKRRGKRREK